MKKYIVILHLLLCQVALSQNIVFNQEHSRVEIPNELIDSFTITNKTTNIYMDSIDGIIINGVIYTVGNGGIAHDMQNLANVNFIPIFGQSLSVGAAAIPIITSECKYPSAIKFAQGIRVSKKAENYFTDFVPLVEELNATPDPSGDSKGSGETVASGCVEMLMELICKECGISPYSMYWDDHKFLFASFGSGSQTIADLTAVPSSGIGYYQGVVNAMNAAKRICESKGWTLNIPAWIWIQGETDQKGANNTPYATYKAALLDLAEQFDTDAKSVTGQTNDVKCICYQTCSQNIVCNYIPTFNDTVMDVPTAQMELVRDNDYFLASNPAYILTHSTVVHQDSTSEVIHLTAEGEKMMGNYCGIALRDILKGTLTKKGVTPKTFSVDGNTIKIECNVPSPPLKINNSWVKEVENSGFKVLNSSSSNILTNVSVFDNTIELTCSASPVGCRVLYCRNGTSGKDGRLLGARGNICDSANEIYSGNVGGVEYPLSNYLYGFAYTIPSEN